MVIREFYGPPSWWYNPPESHEIECQCDRCHAFHKEEGDVPENAEFLKLECCLNELRDWVAMHRWCMSHGDAYLKGHECLECEART